MVEVLNKVGAVVLSDNLRNSIGKLVLRASSKPSFTWEVTISVDKVGAILSWGLSIPIWFSTKSKGA